MAATGFVDSVKEWCQGLGLEKWFGESAADAAQVAIYFVSCFAIGFLFKKYLKLIFFSLIVSFCVIKGLEYYKVLTVDWEQLNTLLGFEPQATFSSILNNAIEWVKAHVIVTVSSSLGFLIGYKVG